MNILFLTLLGFDSLKERNIYTDLLREFVKNGHDVYVVSPVEKRQGVSTHLKSENNAKILRLKIGNVQKTNIFEKGISILTLERKYIRGIKSFFSDVKFDLVLYSTPPITLVSAIEYIRKRDHARTYLLLKDIFPQNAVDMEMMSKTGIKGIIYRYFRKKEQRLYSISDKIGCMSPANVNYVLQHNFDIDSKKVEVCPNSIEILDKSVEGNTRNIIRKKYGIPLEKKVLVYGGNLGKPQGISFLIECIEKCKDIEEAYFLIVGDGTEYHLLEKYMARSKQVNLKVMRRLPKEDYDTLVGACDVGMIFLDYRFTIPNFPSRLLSYMQSRIPILAVTDVNTDIGEIITENDLGWWCESSRSDTFRELIERIVNIDTKSVYEERVFSFLETNYSVANAYNIIIDSL